MNQATQPNEQPGKQQPTNPSGPGKQPTDPNERGERR
jgi:hypothetical protein